MGKSKTASYVVERRIVTHGRSEDQSLEKIFNICNRLYNICVKHYREVMKDLYDDIWYQKAYSKYLKAIKIQDQNEINTWYSEICLCMTAYKLNEFDIHEYIGKGKTNSFNNGIGINITQKVGSALYASVKKAVFRHTKINFRKKGQTVSFEDKKPTNGVIYNDRTGTVKICGKVFHLKPVREKDAYLMQALLSKVKYCRVVRKPFGTKYRYFLQIVMEGNLPKKPVMEPDGMICGIDEGISTVAYTNDCETGFETLANGVEKYLHDVRRWASAYERRRRMANPDCYNSDGTIKKGAKFKNHTKGMTQAVMYLKTAWRKKAAFTKESHNILANKILNGCIAIVKEPMSFRSLAKRSASKKERQNKISIVKSKKGKIRQIQKFKRRKRFGGSVLKHSPGLFNSILERKAQANGIAVFEVDIKKYKASQFDHTTGQYTKCSLSDRVKEIGRHKVQRDLYSSFLLRCFKNMMEPDSEECNAMFQFFLAWQDKVIEKIKTTGDITGNFGLTSFV